MAPQSLSDCVFCIFCVFVLCFFFRGLCFEHCVLIKKEKMCPAESWEAEYWEFSQKSYLNVWCFEKVHICIPKIPYLHTKKFYICILLHILIF